MPTAYSRVTLVNGSRRVDLALPAGLPLADVMPQLLRFCAPGENPEDPAPWTLGRLGGPDLPLTTTLVDSAIGDGEVLELRHTSSAIQTAYVEDVRDVVEDAVDESGRQWRSSTSVQFALISASILLAATAALPAAQRPGQATFLLAALVALLCVGAGGWAGRAGYRFGAQVVLVTAGIWGWLTGWLAGQALGLPPEGSIGAGAVATVAVIALGRALTPVATAHIAAAGLISVGGAVVAGAAVAGLDPLTGVRVDAVLALLVVGVLPRMSLTLGGLANADYRVRTHGLVEVSEVGERIRQSTALLHGSIAAVAAAGTTTGLVLTYQGNDWDRALAMAVGLALVLRSRVFSRIPHVLPLRCAGVVVLAVAGLRALRDTQVETWTVAVAAALAAIVVALSALRLSDVARARLKQMLNTAEGIVVVAMVALAGGALGFYDWIRDLTS